DVLNRQGVIAEPTHFKDIADEQTIRQHLSNLINARIIDGGFGSIIRLTQAGSTAFGVLQREERTKEFMQLKLSIVNTTLEWEINPALLRLKRFFESNSDLLLTSENRSFWEKWLTDPLLELSSSMPIGGRWDNRTRAELVRDLETIRI